jgi:uridine kinase
MTQENLLVQPDAFSKELFEKMKVINEGFTMLELYEFRYGLNEMTPENGWNSVILDTPELLETRVSGREYYDDIQIKPLKDGKISLDEHIINLTRMLFVGLVTGKYASEWVNTHFYFDIRCFFFLHRTQYFTKEVQTHFGGKPFRQFEKKQLKFEKLQDLGYQAFREANSDLDSLFFECAEKLISARGMPILFAIAGQTAAGKTEIVDRLRREFEQKGMRVTSIELDNFLTDRDQREEKGIHSEGKEALHYKLLRSSLAGITLGKSIAIPRYNFIDGTSSHDLEGQLKPGRTPIVIDSAEIIFIEGNFPFLIDEIAPLIGVKVVYLTDDPIRLKRKWKRDMDYRKKYDLNYFRNRYFKDQFIMAKVAYLPQLEICDLAVDTTGAALWTTSEVKDILDRN